MTTATTATTTTVMPFPPPKPKPSPTPRWLNSPAGKERPHLDDSQNDLPSWVEGSLFGSDDSPSDNPGSDDGGEFPALHIAVDDDDDDGDDDDGDALPSAEAEAVADADNKWR
uniref:Uncharacterized protein n=1 Tax=Ananas comosus var. bracteatus TaxID=296719 RepID=A0A6V7NNG4_ANACO|nr:unnamed protein product [Ananas comosus var. bracteatus]